MDLQGSSINPGRPGEFNTTHWSVVLRAAGESSTEADEALENLCRHYWYPLYVHVRRSGWNEDDAKDLTQQFFARFLARKDVERADPERGRFRSFLLTSLKHFLTDAWHRSRAKKRGGDRVVISWDEFDPEDRYRHEPNGDLSPDRLYEKRWATVLLESVLRQLAKEYERNGRLEEFEQLKSFVWGDKTSAYAEMATKLNSSESAVKVAVHRLRKRFREQLRLEVSRTVSSQEEIDAELRHLRDLLSS